MLTQRQCKGLNHRSRNPDNDRERDDQSKRRRKLHTQGFSQCMTSF